MDVLMQLDFGKHKGKHISQLDDVYLRWMHKSFSESSQWQKAAAHILRTRGVLKKRETDCNAHVLVTDLKSCSIEKNLQLGRSIHAQAVENGNDTDMYVASALIRMYAKCGSMPDAHAVFDSIQRPNVVAWTALLLGYAENGEGKVSLELFSKMKAHGCVPDSVAYVAALKACTSLALNGDGSSALRMGREIHLEIGDHLNLYVQNTLIDMYSKSSSMALARQVFDSIQKPDVVSWNSLLLGYAENGEGYISLEMFSKMKADGCEPNSVTYSASVKACTSLAVNGDKVRGLEFGSRIHLEIGRHLNPFLQCTLIDMYAKCGAMACARRVFDSVEKPDVAHWTALVMGYAENGEGNVSLELFSKMKADGCAPDSVTYVACLKACTSLGTSEDGSRKMLGLKLGREIHLQVGSHLDIYVQSALIDMYAKCGSMVDAREVFDSIRNPNVVSWNALLLGYAENGEGHIALELFFKMNADGFVPDSITYVAALKACTVLATTDEVHGLRMGREVHLQIGDRLDLQVQNTLIDMYAKCGSISEARRVFDSMHKPDVVSWNALLLGYAGNGEAHLCLELFSQMKADGCLPNHITYVAALKACTALAANGNKERGSEIGSEIHSDIGNEFRPCVHSALIEMYAMAGSMSQARQVFDSIQKPDVVSWTVLLLGYADNGEGRDCLELFFKMKADGCVPNSVTYVAALKACSLVSDLTLGLSLQAEISVFTVHVVTCLVDLYAKCGSMADARAVFERHSETRDVTTWNALLAGYSSCGDARSVLTLFEAMPETGLRPNGVTFLSVLSCCNHAGLVEKAWHYLEAMPVQYGVVPGVFHYNCMVDVLIRANQPREALAMVRRMPCKPNAVTWSALSGACCKWKNVELGRMAFQSLVELDNEDAYAYVVMGHTLELFQP